METLILTCIWSKISSVPQPETGRMHGAMSILMTGRGDGMFDSVWPETSGLIVPGRRKGSRAIFEGPFSHQSE
jgi:hypothetical protein